MIIQYYHFLSRFLKIIDYFISYFLVMPVIPNDRIDEINRFCKRIDDIKREMFSEVVLSNSSPTNRLDSIGHSIIVTNIRVINNLLSELHWLPEGIYSGIRGPSLLKAIKLIYMYYVLWRTFTIWKNACLLTELSIRNNHKQKQHKRLIDMPVEYQ